MTPKSLTLIVRHLPNCLTESEKVDLLKYFGAESVRCMSTTGRLRHSAFATFSTQEEADSALSKLHQAQLLGQRLVVEYAVAKQLDKYFPSKIDDLPTKNLDIDQSECQASAQDEYKLKIEEFARKVHSQCPELGLDYVLSPMLHYAYPPPNPGIVANICSVLVSVPKFYNQVLHLMNKMNLPAPFGPLLPQPPMIQSLTFVHHQPSASNILLQRPDTALETTSSFEESELESDGEPVTFPAASQISVAPRKRKVKQMKRPKLQKLLQPQPAATQTCTPVTEIFEPVPDTASAKQISFNIKPQTSGHKDSLERPDTDAAALVVEEGGFGVIASKPLLPEAKNESSTDNPYNWEGTEFVSRQHIRDGRVSSEERQLLAVFRNYEAGTPSSRLYIKNIAKGVDDRDLFRVYGNYVNRGSESERNVFDIRLMTEGRMKGQAFLTFANEKEAECALKETNGYILKGKPLVVQFARSAKAKVADVSL